jgi:cytochrome P450
LTTSHPVRFDPFGSTPDEINDQLADLRRECPVHHMDSPEFFTLTRHADIVAALNDSDTWSSAQGPGLHRQDPSKEGGVLVSSDPPLHTFERRSMVRLFKPSNIALMEDDIRELCLKLFEEVAPRGGCDLMADLAIPLPLVVVCRMLGLPEDGWREFRPWVMEAAAGVLDKAGAGKSRIDANAKMFAYFEKYLTARRAQVADGTAPDDLLTGLVNVETKGQKLDDNQIVSFVRFLLVAGSATTTLLIGNVVNRLLQDPAALTAVRSDPALVDVAIEESLRIDAPVLGLFRTNTCPVTMHDVEIPENSKVMISFASANLDDQNWDHPEEFDLGRDPRQLRRHLAFGFGTHFCLGAPLARLEAKCMLETLLPGLPDLRADGDPTTTSIPVLRGFERFPIAWTPA